VMEDGRELEAELVGRDAQTDLAVIRVKEGRDFDYVQFGSSQELRRGDWVVALGNPFGLGGTATSGIVSAIGKPGDRGRSSTYTDYLQIDAAINRGNSGGPTFDLYGRVIGVNTAILSPTGGSVGIGFAIPSDLAKTVTDKLITDGKVSRGWLGVTIQDLTDEMAEARGIPDAEGAIIADVTADSPAKEYGLKRGDIITEVNGTKVTDATSTTRVVGALLAGTDNRFVVLRAGKPTIVNVTVGERPENLTLASGDGPEDREEDSEDAETAPLGVSLRPLDEAPRGDYNLEDEAGGMVVTDVERDSPFLEVSNLRPGMVILDVNGTPITSVEDMESEVAKARRSGRDKVLVAIYTGRQTAFLPVDIAGGDDE
ncbi:MAG: trypsin-like peptidase domain-containing protein, partial [Pseudomonadota bacterium]